MAEGTLPATAALMPKKPSASRPRKTAFVPRAALASVFAGAGVIPLIATMVAGCGGKESGGPIATVALGFVDSGSDAPAFTVACACFDGSMGVASDAFAFDVQLGVAVQAFDSGGEGGDAGDGGPVSDALDELGNGGG